MIAIRSIPTAKEAGTVAIRIALGPAGIAVRRSKLSATKIEATVSAKNAAIGAMVVPHRVPGVRIVAKFTYECEYQLD